MIAQDALVVGGGLAGAAFATRLAEAGRDVVLIEREAGPHDKVCGEFLSHGALDRLERLGVSPADLGAVPIERVLLACGRTEVSRRLPFRAASLSRQALDEALLARAEAVGVKLLRGSGVAELARGTGGWTARLANGDPVEAKAAALACGKHDLRGQARPPGLQNDLIGVKLHIVLSRAAAAELENAVVIGLFPGGYAGLELVEGGRANLCLVVRRATFAGLGRDWASLVSLIHGGAPALGRYLKDAAPVHARPLAIAKIPYGHVQRTGDDLWRLGDQAAVIPSFCGEGMSLALHSAFLGATHFLAGASSEAFQTAFARDVGPRVRVAAWLSGAIVRRPAQRLAIGVAKLVPSVLPALASATRIRPSRALGLVAWAGDSSIGRFRRTRPPIVQK